MQRALTLYSSTIGKKVAMALSGLVIVGFTVGHLLGNLNAYRGEAAFNEYAATLHSMPPLIWGTRLVLLAAFGAHIWSAFVLVNRNRDARPQRYHKAATLETTPSAKFMAISGMTLAAYLVFHLIHLTIAPSLFTPSDSSPFYNFYMGFQQPVIALVYIVGNLALGAHLYHGFFSAFQTIGANHPRYNSLRRDASIVLAAMLTVGNLSFPIAVMAGGIDAPADVAAQVEAEGSHH